jgi:hypothetical protein
MRKQELALRQRAWRHDEARMAAGTACRAWKRATGRSKAAVGHGVTRGITRKQELVLGCCDGEQRRGAGRADSRAAWHGGEKTARLGGAVAQGWGGTWLGPEQRRDGRGAAHGWQSGGGMTQRGNRGGGGEVDEGGLDCNFQKVQGLYCNAQTTFKPELK